MSLIRIRLRRGTAAEWSSVNPTLAAGELGLEIDTTKLKVGNGTASWNALSYLPPAAHQSAHALGGVDPLTPADIGTLSSAQIEAMLDTPGSREIYVDCNRTDAYIEDGSILRPFKTMRAALASVPSAATLAEFNNPSMRFYCFRIAPGFYDEEAGGTLNIPFRPGVVFDLVGGATLKGNYQITDPGTVMSGSFTIPAAITTGSNVIAVPTSHANYSRLKVGAVVTGTGVTAVAPNTTTFITAINGTSVTLSNNATATNANATISVAAGELGNSVFAMVGSNNRPAYNNGLHSYIGILGNLTVNRINGSGVTFTQVHLTRCGVRGVIELTGTGSPWMQLYCWSNVSFDTVKAIGSNNIQLYGADSQSSQAGNAFGNLIGNVSIQNIDNCYFHSWSSVFLTGGTNGLVNADGLFFPAYNEIKANSFTRTNNVATVTLEQNHNQSRDLLPDGYWREQYVLISGVSENTSFNTPAYGAKVVAYPAANQVSYESNGPDVSTGVSAANAKWIKGTFLGNATGSFLQPGPFALTANEAAIHTFPGWNNNTQPGSGSAFICARASAVTFRYPLTSWTAYGLYVRNRLLTPGNGYQYRALPTAGVGRGGATQPVWPTIIGASVSDGSVTWQCEPLGFAPAANITFVGSITSGSEQVAVTTGAVQTAAFQVGQSVIGTGIPANTTILAISGATLTLSSNATATNATAALTVSGLPATIGFNVQHTLELLHDSKNIYHNQIDSGVAGATTVQAAIKTLKGQVDGKPSLVAVPASATSAGTAGQIAYDANFVYLCTAANTWARAALAAW